LKTLMQDHGGELLKGALGVASTALGVLTSFQENVEHLMRCVSLGVGMMVGILTAISIVRGWKKKP
jgi:hypothetical protein